MSWDPYVGSVISSSCEKGDDQQPIAGTNHCDTAILIGLNGAIWCTPGAPGVLKIDQGEAMKIATAIASDSETEFQMNGVHIGGIKYRYLRKTEDIYVAKCKDQGMITMKKSKQAIIIAQQIEGKAIGNVNGAVKNIAEYLENLGY